MDSFCHVCIFQGRKDPLILMQDEYGQVVEPYSLSAGLDYPGVGPLHAFLYESERAKFMNATDQEALDAFVWLSQKEGIIPAFESSHAVAYLKKMKKFLKIRIITRMMIILRILRLIK